jgi:VWFA-related protein
MFAAAPAAATQDPQPPRIRVDANFVRVDAYPLKDGKPLLGLQAEDFEIFEDGEPQRVETFEHVVVRVGGSQQERVDPGSQRAMLAAAANPRTRVFVIFLDVPHVTVAGAHTINEPLIRLLDNILGPDDLVGVMTPSMAASQIVLGRKTQVLAEGLRTNWPWGERQTYQKDDRERAYEACYPPLVAGEGFESNLAKALIVRKRERATLEAIQDLVRYLRSIREERKAILTVTEGWLLYAPDRELMRLREAGKYKEPVPTLDPVVVGPNGTLTTKEHRNVAGDRLGKGECDADRSMLSMLDNKQFFRDLLDEANRANASFYPIDPRGLPVFDTSIKDNVPVSVDHAMLRQRIETLQTLAENTDGMAVVNSNDIDRGLRRMADDLTSYYLLGYHSRNTKLDGQFRALRVRVKQPGVTVRARRGYRAASAEEVATARRAADAPVPEITRATTAAIDRLGRIRPDARFRVHAVPAGPSAVWIVGELQGAGGKPDEFAQGGSAAIDVVTLPSRATTSAKVVLKPGERTFLTRVDLPAAVTGDLDVRVRLSSTESPSLPLADNVRVDVAQLAGHPLVFRRGPTTGNRVQPAADFRFTRTERVRMEIPVGTDAKPGTGRLLDRAGQPLQVAVTMSERTDESGQRWIVADLTLAPLTVGDYAVEIGVARQSEERVLVGIRVTR